MSCGAGRGGAWSEGILIYRYFRLVLDISRIVPWDTKIMGDSCWHMPKFILNLDSTER